MNGRAIDRAEQARLLASFTYAFRWEAQRRYTISYERADLARWVADGSSPQGAWWSEWLGDITRLTREEHSKIARVRVLDDPPTTYQRWELFLTPQNIAAGEDIRWLSRATARDLGMPGYDWWLIDGQLIVITYNDAGEVATRTLVTEPDEIDRHCAWRDLAVSHAQPAEQLAA